MKTFKTFTLNKNKQKTAGDTKPDYNISTKDGEEFVNIGGAWLKQDKNNQSYLSLSLASSFDKEKNPIMLETKGGEKYQKKGYVILEELEYHELLKKVNASTGEIFNDIIPF